MPAKWVRAPQARAQLFPLIEIVSKMGSAVLMLLADYEALEQTTYLLRRPARATHPPESI